ncbi:hypothetical protein SEA_UPYO_70 [Gordonia phage Upyo]|nr:hypothetical protein SEA_UPYO_70 [Gordonia phage Upyo]
MNDDEPREPESSYKPFIPVPNHWATQPPPNRAQRRARAQIQGRRRRRMTRATKAALRDVGIDKPWVRDRDDEGGTVSLDLESGEVTTAPDVAELEAHLED